MMIEFGGDDSGQTIVDTKVIMRDQFFESMKRFKDLPEHV